MGAPGGPKTGGRKKGTPNKNSANKIPVQELCDKHGINPIEVLLEFCKPIEPGLSPEQIMGRLSHRFQAAKELAQYLYPKKKEMTVTMTAEEHIKAAEELLNEPPKET